MSRRGGPVRAPGEKVAEGVRRRAVLRAGAWAVPAVTVVAAAPAQAVSATPTLTVDWGISRVLWAGYPVLEVRGASVVSSVPLAAGALLFTVSLTPAGYRLDGSLGDASWQSVPTGRVGALASQLGTTVAAGQPVWLPSGYLAAADQVTTPGGNLRLVLSTTSVTSTPLDLWF